MNRPTGTVSDGSAESVPVRRRWWRPLAVVGVVWVLAVAVALVVGVGELGDGAEDVAAARRQIRPDQLRSDGAERRLRSAHRHFARAELLLTNPAVAPARLLPIAGRQLRSAGALARAADRVSDGAAVAARRSRLLLEDRPRDGAERLEAAEELVDILTDAERDLTGVDLGPDAALIAPLAHRRRAFATDLQDARRTVVSGRLAVETVAGLLRGPRRYLLLAANNAEMRSGSGMFLSAGVLETAGGDFTLSPMERTGDLTLGADGVPYDGLDPDLSARWGFLHPNREWRNLGATARFDATAPLAARMWELRTGQRVDGVLAVDVAALEAIVAATGPVDAGGRTLDATSVVTYLLHDQYLEIDEGAGRTSSQTERREDLGALAAAATEAIQRGGFDTEVLVSGLVEAVNGRHLLAWSSAPQEQRGWEAAGAAGTLGPDDVLLGLLNRGGNKLDPFVRPEVDVSGAPSAGQVGTTFELTVRLRNRVDADEVAYIAGPGEGIDAPPGTYIGLLSLHLPDASQDVAVDGAPVVVAGGDGPTRVVAAEVVVARGEERVVTFRFTLPSREGAFTVAPSARLPAARWHTGERTWTDRRPRRVIWRGGRVVPRP
jgi:hypothetical protein